MTERKMTVQVGYDYFVGAPHDVAMLIQLSERMVRADYSKDYKTMHPHAEPRHFVMEVRFVEFDADGPQISAIEPPALIEPAPAPAFPPNQTKDNSTWEAWLAECRYIEGATKHPEPEERLRGFFDAGETPDVATSIPF
jgi:hypothetical protein